MLPSITTELEDLGLLFSLPLIINLMPFKTKVLEKMIILNNLVTKDRKGLWYFKYLRCSAKKVEKSLLE